MSQSIKKLSVPLTPGTLLGPHPKQGTWIGDLLDHADGTTPRQVAHRALSTRGTAFPASLEPIQAAVLRHHGSQAQHASAALARQAFTNQGVPFPKTLRRIPLDDRMRKGNFAEVMLAEYIKAAGGAQLPVYRLRHNPNIDQSMKGDDVLAFDLDANPVRVIVGEAKFRKTSAAAVVKEILMALQDSSAVGVPASLQFVADCIVNDQLLAERVMACARLFADKKIRVDYVGLLLSDTKASARIKAHPPTTLRRLLLLSWEEAAPELLVDTCLQGLI